LVSVSSVVPFWRQSLEFFHRKMLNEYRGA
jgi:hypothetical protein